MSPHRAPAAPPNSTAHAPLTWRRPRPSRGFWGGHTPLAGLPPLRRRPVVSTHLLQKGPGGLRAFSSASTTSPITARTSCLRPEMLLSLFSCFKMYLYRHARPRTSSPRLPSLLSRGPSSFQGSKPPRGTCAGRLSVDTGKWNVAKGAERLRGSGRGTWDTECQKLEEFEGTEAGSASHHLETSHDPRGSASLDQEEGDGEMGARNL